MANFTTTPNEVQYQGPVYPVKVTQGDSFKQDYQLLDTTAKKRFKLIFKRLAEATRDAIISHYEGQYGPFASFTWTTVPPYIDGGSEKTVRYLGQPAISNVYAAVKRYDILLEFEEAV
jgi:hypothetical protein